MKPEINVDQPYNLCLLSGYHPSKLGAYTKIEWLPKPIAISIETSIDCSREIRIVVLLEKSNQDSLSKDVVSTGVGDYIAIHKPKECFKDYTYTDCLIFYITNFCYDPYPGIDGVSKVIIYGKQVTHIADRHIFYKIYKSNASRSRRYFKPLQKEIKVITSVLKGNTMPVITHVIINNPAVIVFWSDGDKTIGKSISKDTFDPEVGLSMAISRKYYKTLGFPYPRGAFKQQIKNAEDKTVKTADKKARKELAKQKQKEQKGDE